MKHKQQEHKTLAVNKPGLWTDQSVYSSFAGLGAKQRLPGSGIPAAFDSEDVIINGQPVNISHLTEKIKSLPGILDVFMLKGTLFDAYYLTAVVELTDKTLNEIKIRNLLLQQLPAYMVPARIRIADKLPESGDFKLDYLNMKKSEEETEQVEETETSQVNSTIRMLWKRHTSFDSGFDLNNTFKDCGGTLTNVMYLADDIEKEFNIELPLAYMQISLRPSFLLSFIEATISGEKFDSESNDYKICVFLPVSQLLAEEADLLTKIESRFETLVIRYPLSKNSHFTELSLEKLAWTVIRTYFSGPVNMSTVFLGISNGNLLAQRVAGMLQGKRKPLMQINPDFRVGSVTGNTTLIKAALWTRYMKARLLKQQVTNIQERILEATIPPENAKIPLVFIAAKNVSDKPESYDLSRRYTKSILIETPYISDRLLRDVDAQNLIVTIIKAQVNDMTQALNQSFLKFTA